MEHSVPLGTDIDDVVFRRTDTIRIRLTFYNPNSVDTLGTFSFENPEFAKFDQVVYSLAPASSSITVPALGTALKEVTLSGMPTLVTYGTLQARVRVIPTQGAFFDDPQFAERIFLTDSTPLGVMNPVWIEVLLDACKWANNQAGSANCMIKCTFGLFWSTILAYDGDDTHYCDESQEAEGQFKFKLRKLISDRTTGPFVAADCRDVNGYLYLSSIALGVPAQIERQQGSLGPVVTNALCPIGADASQFSSYVVQEWNFHQITLQAGAASDSCAAQWEDLNSNPFRNPPSMWSVDPWFQTANSQYGQPGEPFFLGLVSGYVASYPAIVGRSHETWTLTEVI